MNRIIRETGRAFCAFLVILTLIGQSVLPVSADTVDKEGEGAGSGYTVSEEGSSYSLEYFDRIAVNSVRGILTIRSGDDFGISFPAGWDETPGFSVQDDILVVSGRKSADQPEEKSGDGSAVVIGEDEPSPDSAGQSEETAAETGTGEESAPVREADPSQTPEMVITIPAGVGLETLRVAMEDGDLVMTDITADSVTIQSGGGNLVMRNVSLGTVDIYSDTGSVDMTECTFGSLNIGMGEGNVSVTSAEGLSRCRMELKTGDGEITYNGIFQGLQYLQPGNGKRFLTIQVTAGNIDISE